MTASPGLAGRAGFAAALAVLAGCGLEPDVGPLLAGSCSNADSDPVAQVSFAAQIQPVFNQSSGGCSCHVPSPSGPGPGTQLGGLDLSSLDMLRAGGVGSGPRIVVAGQPCESVLFQKLTVAPPFGSRMPLGGPFLSAAELQLLHDWIAEGAGDN